MSIFGFVMYFFSFSALLLDVLCYSLVIVQFGHNLNECVCVCLLSVWERKVSLFFFSLPFLLKFTCTFLQKLKLHEDASKYIFFILWAIANFPTTFLSWFIQNLVLLMLINRFHDLGCLAFDCWECLNCEWSRWDLTLYVIHFGILSRILQICDVFAV